MSKPWVLLTEGRSGRSRATLAAARALANAGYRPAVTVSGPRSLAASSRACMRRVHVPVAGEPGYKAAIRAELERNEYLTVIPSSDAALLALQAPGAALLDKSYWPAAARAAGIETPPTQQFASVAEMRAGHVTYPCVVKPTTKRFLARMLRHTDDLDQIPDDGPLLVQPFLADRMRAVCGLMWEGRLVGAVHQRYERLWPFPCGTVSAATTTPPDVELERRISVFLRDYTGLFHLEFAGDRLLDVNPRVHALMQLGVAAGSDLVVMYCDLLNGEKVEDSRGREGVFYRWIEGDVRSILKQARLGAIPPPQAARCLLPRRGTVHSFETLSDPGPLFEDLRFVAGNVADRLRARI